MLLSALKIGGIVIIDELEIKLHPAIVVRLLELFNDPEVNTGKGQIIFSSHMPALIDLLGKYHTYLVEKNDQKSEVYPLSDFPEARADQKLAPLYLAGKFGGVPRI